MNFDFSEEQTQLRDALGKLLDRSAGFDARKELIRAGQSHSPKLWRQLAELGALAVALPEDLGGTGGTAVDTMIVCEALGRRLVLEPYVASAVVGAGLLAHAGSAAQKAELLPKLAEGQHLCALAHGERAARYHLPHLTTSARRDGDSYVLHGDKHVVLGGDCAHTLIVSARTSGGAEDRQGHTLLLVDAAAPGLTRRAYRTQDNLGAADVELRAVRVPVSAVLGEVGAGLPVVEDAVGLGMAALCAEAVGAMAVMIELTADYVKTRKQFGVAIGQFQALQHRLADMLMRLEQARSMTYLAASTLASGGPSVGANAGGGEGGDAGGARQRVLSAAKAMVGQCGRFVGQGAIQLHGGIGMTEEAQVSHYFKRVTAIDLTFGDADHHVAKVSDALLR